MQALVLVLSVYTVNTRFSDTLGEKADNKKKKNLLDFTVKTIPKSNL